MDEEVFVWNAITIVNSSEKIQIGRKINKIFRFVQEKSKKSSKKTTFFAHTRIIIRYIQKFLVSLQTGFLSVWMQANLPTAADAGRRGMDKDRGKNFFVINPGAYAPSKTCCQLKTFTLQTQVAAYKEQELPAEIRELVEAAKANVSHSYSPYSRFAVSAAIRLADGTIMCGTNQENCAYPSGLCAERTTLFYAHSQHPELAVTAIAICCFTDGHFTEQPGSPCGACRQVMTEFEHIARTPMQVILYGAEQTFVFRSAADLLPLTFIPESLNG